MPRVAAPRAAPREAPVRAEAAQRPPAIARRPKKKPAPQQDRLTARKLFFRRVRRSVKPGIWLIGVVCVILLVSEAFRALPAVGPVISPAGTFRHGVSAAAAMLGFRVQRIEVVGADTTPQPVIEAALGVATGAPSFGFSLQAAAARIEALGPVQSAVVRRALPGTIIVTVKERAPYAIWQTQDENGAAKFVLIDKAGNVIAEQDATAAKRRNPALLLLVGADAPQCAATLMAELQAQKAVFARVVAAERIDRLRWNITLRDGAVVKLPADDEATALAQLAGLQNSMALLDRPVEWIDLRQADKLVVHPYPPSAGHS